MRSFFFSELAFVNGVVDGGRSANFAAGAAGAVGFGDADATTKGVGFLAAGALATPGLLMPAGFAAADFAFAAGAAADRRFVTPFGVATLLAAGFVDLGEIGLGFVAIGREVPLGCGLNAILATLLRLGYRI